MITAEEARQQLHYNPKTGHLYRRSGKRAGTLSDRYIRLSINNRRYLAHRVIWLMVYGEWPLEIDHINQNRTDNRLCNLREVTRQENKRNETLRSTNKPKVTGVCWSKSKRCWRSNIVVDARQMHLGYFHDWFDAVCARKAANNKYGFHKNHGRICPAGN